MGSEVWVVSCEFGVLGVFSSKDRASVFVEEDYESFLEGSQYYDSVQLVNIEGFEVDGSRFEDECWVFEFDGESFVKKKNN